MVYSVYSMAEEDQVSKCKVLEIGPELKCKASSSILSSEKGLLRRDSDTMSVGW